jgi:hypothetical protein
MKNELPVWFYDVEYKNPAHMKTVILEWLKVRNKSDFKSTYHASYG